MQFACMFLVSNKFNFIIESSNISPQLIERQFAIQSSQLYPHFN